MMRFSIGCLLISICWLTESNSANADLVVDSLGTYDLLNVDINLRDDLRIFNGAALMIAGNANLTIGDDLRARGNAMFPVNLIGTTLPTKTMGDDTRLGNKSTLNIDTSAWPDGDQVIALFDVADQLPREFSTSSVNGVPLDPTSYSFNHGPLFVPVTEPSAHVMALLGILFVALYWSRSSRDMRSRSKPKLKSLMSSHRVDHGQSDGQPNRWTVRLLSRMQVGRILRTHFATGFHARRCPKSRERIGCDVKNAERN